MAVYCRCGRAIFDSQTLCSACSEAQRNGNPVDSKGNPHKASYSATTNSTYELLVKQPFDTPEYLSQQNQTFSLPSRPQTTPPRSSVSPASSERSTVSRQSSDQLCTMASNFRKSSVPDAYSPMAAGFARLGKRQAPVDVLAASELRGRPPSSKGGLDARMMFSGPS